jgi:hypothetical protein
MEITSEKLLIVEGKNDERLFRAILKHLAIDNIQLIDMKGLAKFRGLLKDLVNAPNFHTVKTIGIIRDADTNQDDAFKSVCNSLKSVKLDAPDKNMSCTGKTPKICVMILPGDNAPGMLEDICLNTLTNENTGLDCADDFLECIREKGLLRSNNLSKSKIHALLAVSKDPEHDLGQAAQAGYFDWNHSAFDDLKEFLTNL